MKRLLAVLLTLMLLLPPACAVGEQSAYGLQDCHRFTLTEQKGTRPNGATVSRWQIKSANAEVDKKLNAIAKAWADEIGPTLPAPGSSASRVNCIIRPSRTGLTWMSFMLQARTVINQQNRGLRFTTRTYDMKTGDRVLLTDVFPADSAAWGLMAEAIRERVNLYFPGEKADEAALARVTTREAIEQMDFTLHGMSLVLHLNAADFYPGHVQLIEVTLYYPDIRGMMTERAQVETDNLKYYKTVALTYDDGPNGWCTDQMLLALMKGGERATFFLVGERIVQQSFIVQRQHDEGHSIATHNYVHVYANSTAREVLQSMPAKVDKAHITAIGIAPTYARAPGGQWERMAAAELGWPLIQWTVEAADWQGEEGPDPAVTSANIVAGTGDGGVILMHDLKANSFRATETIISRLQEKGFIFLTVDELFAKDGVKLQPDTAYWRCTNGVITKELPR